MKHVIFVIAIILTIPTLAVSQQKDTLIVKDSTGKVVASPKVKKGLWKDSAGNRTFEPRKAALYSAILPGLGQAYNKKYWKVPLAWAAVGIPIYTYLFNRQQYNRLKYALEVVSMDRADPAFNEAFEKVYSELRNMVLLGRTERLLANRNEYRKDMDYSVLFTLLFWGLNVVDATVDAHLKGFNVNENLSMQIKPALLSNSAVGVSLVFRFDKNGPKN